MSVLLTLIAGARPNFMKIAPLIRAIRARGDACRYRLVHTGQHYDRDMNDVFFEELGIPQPDVSLGAGGGSHSEQTAKIMLGVEAELIAHRPDWLIVVGDVNSTLAASIVAKKLGIRVAHVEAGLRSGDRAMPEEINRLVTDAISDVFFVTEPSGTGHLLREGQDRSKIYEVGHVMIDNLLYQAAQLDAVDAGRFATEPLRQRLLADAGRYGVVTLHRPSNVDGVQALTRVVGMLNRLAAMLPLVFPVHPRTRQALQREGLQLDPAIHLTGPLPYMEFLNLWRAAAVVVTDSGGLQEETTGLGVACVTVRNSTERPVTVDEGTNVLAGTDPDAVLAAVTEVLAGRGKTGRRPALWDGQAAERIVQVLLDRTEPATDSV